MLTISKCIKRVRIVTDIRRFNKIQNLKLQICIRVLILLYFICRQIIIERAREVRLRL